MDVPGKTTEEWRKVISKVISLRKIVRLKESTVLKDAAFFDKRMLAKRVAAVYDGHARDEMLRLMEDVGLERETGRAKRGFAYKRFEEVVQWCKVGEIAGESVRVEKGACLGLGVCSFYVIPWAV
ncbi:hypothetical protein LTR08_006703 [Meristemomyces frigidus]|nr:hypothetical protein LTR08_006703 [Meristemomyces frigidus]